MSITITFVCETAEEAKCYADAPAMKIAIESYYDDCIRPTVKYGGLPDGVMDTIESINHELYEHFKCFKGD